MSISVTDDECADLFLEIDLFEIQIYKHSFTEKHEELLFGD